MKTKYVCNGVISPHANCKSANNMNKNYSGLGRRKKPERLFSCPPPLIFSEIQYMEINLKWLFSKQNALKRVSVNKWTNLYSIFACKMPWTIFELFYFIILRGWETGKEKPEPVINKIGIRAISIISNVLILIISSFLALRPLAIPKGSFPLPHLRLFINKFLFTLSNCYKNCHADLICVHITM